MILNREEKQPQEELNRWLAFSGLDVRTREELLAMREDPQMVDEHFSTELSFGTGGMRGIMGPGSGRINIYTIRRATQGLANYLLSSPGGLGDKKVAIAYDNRSMSEAFARETAAVLAASGIKALLFPGIRPTPILSYVTRELRCSAGIVITASHNPPQYNGYKVYGPDGGQAVGPFIDGLTAYIDQVDIFTDVKTIAVDTACAKGLITMIDPALEKSYLEAVKKLSLNHPGAQLKVVYTPLHGTGTVHIPKLLQACDFIDLILVEEQMTADPAFSTVESPNPEEPEALRMAIEKAKETGADLVLATDPDGDRVGVAVSVAGGNYRILSGNQVGALLVDYICCGLQRKGIMPAEPILVKTIVTGDLGKKIATTHGVSVVETLTGFKYMAALIEEYERTGQGNFIFGYEESCGYLAGTFVRDKDGAIASYLIAEMAAFYSEEGISLNEKLEQLYRIHGYHHEELATISLKNTADALPYIERYRNLKGDLAGQKIIEKRDYEISRGINLLSGAEFKLNLPVSTVFHYTLEDGSWFAVRPSGTEPKVKFYLTVCAADGESAQGKMAALRRALEIDK